MSSPSSRQARLDQLQQQATDLLRAISAGEAVTIEELRENREDEHTILELTEDTGIQLPDTAPMAVHRGRMDPHAAAA